MARGDHLKVRRALYAHHGIDMGDGTVIHYSEWVKWRGKKGGPQATRTSLAQFGKGGAIKAVRYPRGRCLPVEETCGRACQALLTAGDYHLVFNNCEHFASYCKTGSAKSRQVRRAAALAGGALGMALLVVLRGRRGKF